MKFLDEASLPRELQGSGQFWQKEKKFASAWLDLTKVPPLPIREGLIGPDLALQLAHEKTTRAALKKHATPQALDHFVAGFCRQVPEDPSVHFRYNAWRSIAEELGGPETAAIFLPAMTDKAFLHEAPPGFGGHPYVHAAAGVLAGTGDASCLPALILCRYRFRRMRNHFMEGWLNDQLVKIVKRLALPPAGLEDWCLPDAAEPDEIPEFRKDQAPRLRKAMLTDRRWTVAMFDRRIVRQPVMAPLAAGLVWGYYNQAGRLIQPFLIGPGFEYPPPPADASVGVVHPVHLPSAEAARWRERAKQLKAPFDQWSVPAQALSAQDLQGDRIPRLPAIKLPAATLLCRLEALGWQRPKDRRLFQFHGRPFPELGVCAVIRYTGIPLTYGSEWPDQSLLECFFVTARKQIPLSQVSPIAISAVLADLEALFAGPSQ
jgi:hypothetical protein